MLIISMENANYILQTGPRHLTKMTTEELFTSFQNGLGHFKAKLPRFNKLFVTFKVHLF